MLASALTTAPAMAQGTEVVTLDYDAPAGCGSREQVMNELRRALTEPGPLPEVSARVRVREVDGRYLLEFHADKAGSVSRRRLRVDSCEAATEVAALLLLLTLDPVLADQLGADAVVERQGEEDFPVDDVDTPPPNAAPSDAPLLEPAQGAEASESAPEPPSPEPPSPGPRTDEPRAVEVSLVQASDVVDGGWLGLGPAMISGMTPSVAYGGVLRGGLRMGRFRLAAGAGYLVAPESPIDGVPDAGVRASMLRVNARVEPQFGTGPFRFGPAAGVALEYVVAEAVDVTNGQSGGTQWLSAQVGAWTTIMITDGWGLELDVGATLPFERPRYRVSGIADPVHRPGVAGVEVFFGGFWAWGSQF